MPLAVKNIHSTIGEFQRNYLYKIFIETVPEVTLAEFPNALKLQSDIDLYNTKAVFPDRKTNKITQNWAGEFFVIPGTDATTRETDLEFFDDEPKWVMDFFNSLKDLTGNMDNHAAVVGIQSKFNIGIAQVSVDKKTITEYRRLVGVRVYEVDDGEESKEGDTISKLRVNIAWDGNEIDKAKRGLTV